MSHDWPKPPEGFRLMRRIYVNDAQHELTIENDGRMTLYMPEMFRIPDKRGRKKGVVK